MWPSVLGFVSGLDNLIGKMGGHWSPRIELNSKYCLCFCHDFLFVSSPIRGLSWSVFSLTHPNPLSLFALSHTHTGKKHCLFYALQMKCISEWMARDTEGAARKPSSVPTTSAFFRKFAISLKGQCKLGLLTNELPGQDMEFQ